MNSIEKILQLCLNKLEYWADEDGFKLSRSKTVCVHFCQQSKFHPDPTLRLYGIDIPVLKQTKLIPRDNIPQQALLHFTYKLYEG